MKKLFFVLALSGFLGASAINTVSAVTHTKVFVNGGEEDKDKKKKKKKCCSKDAANATADGKSSCSASGKKCCASKATSQAGKSCGDKKTSSSDVKTDVKPVEEKK